MAITPVGFLVIEEGRAMMITPNSGRWDWLVEGIPEIWERFSKTRQESKERKAGSARTAAEGPDS